MKKVYRKRTKESNRKGNRVGQEVQLTLDRQEVLRVLQQEIHAFAVEAGLVVAGCLLTDEVERLCGPRYAHDPNVELYRHGAQPGWAMMAGQKVRIEKPRVRRKNGGEGVLESYRLLQQADALDEAALRRMVHGVSTRNYEQVVDTVRESYGVKKSCVSRNFVRASAAQLKTLCERRWDGQRFVAIFIDGKTFAEELIVVALGVTEGGEKRILGLRQGATENARVVTALLADLAGRGVRTDLPTLFVLDGAKALVSAVKKMWGECAFIQRCRIHKRRNVEAHVAERLWPEVKQRLDAAYAETDPAKALKSLKTTAAWLERLNPDAAASLREGMAETLTVTRLGVEGILRKTLATTNPIESALSVAEETTRRVKRWRDGNMRLRWCAAGLLKAESRFRRVKGYRDLPKLIQMMERELGRKEPFDFNRQAA
jgi:putative transposase